MITYLKGDATSPIKTNGSRIICHICNDVGKWGKGFVLALRKKFPKAEFEYRSWYKTNKLFSLGNILIVPQDNNIFIANMIAQHDIVYKNGIPPIRYDALDSCLKQLQEFALAENATIHMPRIGCGLAGGKWSEVEKLIVDNLTNFDINVYVYDID